MKMKTAPIKVLTEQALLMMSSLFREDVPQEMHWCWKNIDVTTESNSETEPRNGRKQCYITFADTIYKKTIY